MLRRLIDKLMGRKKEPDKTLSFSEILGLLEDLDSSIEIDLSYERGIVEIEFYSENPSNVVEFLRRKFKDAQRYSAKYQVVADRHEREHCIALIDKHQEVSITYSTQIS